MRATEPGRWRQWIFSGKFLRLLRGLTWISGQILASQLVPVAQNPAVHCVAFEPDPTNFSHLRENIRRNCQHGNVDLVQAAVMDQSGSVSLGLNRDGNPGDHRVIFGNTKRTTVRAPAIALDNYFANASGPIAVKIDTQGTEPFVIAGGWNTLSRAGALVIEFDPRMISELGASPDMIYALVKEFSNIGIAPREDSVEEEFDDPDQAISMLSRHYEEAKAGIDFWNIFLSRGPG